MYTFLFNYNTIPLNSKNDLISFEILLWFELSYHLLSRNNPDLAGNSTHKV